MREETIPADLEVALLKVATPSLDSSREALLRRIESLESRLNREGGPMVEPPKTVEVSEAVEAPKPPPAEDETPDRDEPQASVATATVEIERVVELWPAVVDHLRDSGSAMLSTLFDEAKPLAIDEERSVLRIGFPASATFNKKKAESPVNVERMTEALASIAGHRLRPVYELIDGPGEDASEESAEISEEDLVDLVKDSFDASEVVPDGERERGTG
jgi:DNA polymerase-3 subunit gamma/tau